MTALLSAAGLVFVAELGDKTQLVVLTLGAGRRPLPALAGLTVIICLLQAVAVLAGDALGAALDPVVVGIATGMLFLAFGAWTWTGAPASEAGEDTDASPAAAGSLPGLLVAFLLAELGDKTNLATASLATRTDPLPTWVGASVGLLAATALGLLAGTWLQARLGARRLALGGAVAFVLAGVATLAVTFVG